jgi:hypothetical protein
MTSRTALRLMGGKRLFDDRVGLRGGEYFVDFHFLSFELLVILKKSANHGLRASVVLLSTVL